MLAVPSCFFPTPKEETMGKLAGFQLPFVGGMYKGEEAL
jgi:hypothetical protein